LGKPNTGNLDFQPRAANFLSIRRHQLDSKFSLFDREVSVTGTDCEAGGVKRAARRSDPRSRIEHIRVRNVSVQPRLGEFRTRELNRSALHGKFIHLNRVDNLTSDGSLEACLSLPNSEACAGKLPRQITLVEFGENLARSHQISRLHKHVAYATSIPEIEISFLGSDDPTKGLDGVNDGSDTHRRVGTVRCCSRPDRCGWERGRPIRQRIATNQTRKNCQANRAQDKPAK
jgi:hypothetical protein